MSKVLDTLDTAKFWAVVAAVLAFAVLAYAYGHNRKQATTNAATIARQQEQLSYLCETVAIIDAATTDRIRITREALAEPVVPAWAQAYLGQTLSSLLVQHAELANNRGCRQIE